MIPWKSLPFTFLISYTGTFGFSRAWGGSFETACWWSLGMACISLTIHRLILLADNKGI
jgi:hypothetical protein